MILCEMKKYYSILSLFILNFLTSLINFVQISVIVMETFISQYLILISEMKTYFTIIIKCYL